MVHNSAFTAAKSRHLYLPAFIIRKSRACSSVWLERCSDKAEAESSNLSGPIYKNLRQNRGSNLNFGPDYGSNGKVGSGCVFNGS